MTLNVTRRGFIGGCAAASAAGALSAWTAASLAAAPGKTNWRWLWALEDPVYKMIPGEPALDQILMLFPPVTGKPAFDPQLIAENIKRLRPVPAIDTGHPFLDLSVKTGLAHIDATFRGDHPKYGVGVYASERGDGFPPTIIAAVDALTAWGMHARAATLFQYWLLHFVREDGTINYYGPSIAEYGQLLHTAALLEERAGPAGWWDEGHKALDRIAEHLLRLQAAAAKEGKLIAGVPEADTRDQVKMYFHNNAWAAKGLRRWAGLCARRKASPATAISTVRNVSATLGEDTLRAIRKTWPADPSDWRLSPQVEPFNHDGHGITDCSVLAFANYRYWLELLSSGLLPTDLANRVVKARLSGGGSFCGNTRFSAFLNNWPLVDWLYGLWALGRKRDFLMSLYGHVSYHQAEDHLTAYESVTFPPGKKVDDYCLPCQLIAARAARLLVKPFIA